MKRMLEVLALCVPLAAGVVFAQEAVPNTFFGMNPHLDVVRKAGWPVVPFGSLRLWDTNTRWFDLIPSPAFIIGTT